MAENTRDDYLARMGKILADKGHYTFPQVDKEAEINQVLRTVVSSELKCYKRSATVQIKNKINKYDFPTDMLEIVSMSDQEMKGTLLIHESWTAMAKYQVNHFNAGFISYYSFDFETSEIKSGYQAIIRELTSQNEFIYNPEFDASESSETVYEQDTIPSSGSKNEIWIDSYLDEDLIYYANDDFASGFSAMTVALADRPTGTLADLVFTAVTTGTQMINIAFVDAGASGVSALVKTGSGTRADPYLYTFNLYDDDNSNDAIILLLSGDPDLGAAGADATDGATYLTFTSTQLTHAAATYWTPKNIFIQYVAMLPEMTLGTQEVHPSIPTSVRFSDCIPYLAAGSLLSWVEGGNRDKGRGFEAKGMGLLQAGVTHRNNKGGPRSARPK